MTARKAHAATPNKPVAGAAPPNKAVVGAAHRIFVRPIRGKRSAFDPAFMALTADHAEECVVNVCSTGKEPFALTLSPFYVGPCALPWSFSRNTTNTPREMAKNMENAWQFAKVYSQHADPETGEPTDGWYRWAHAGFTNSKAVRFPMGRGAKPLYSFGGFNPDGTVVRWGYVEARFRIYAPLYADLVDGSIGYAQLRARLVANKYITLLDFDGWNHEAHGLTLEQTMYHPGHKCGHGFILAMMLAGVRVWEGPFRGQEGIDDAIAAEARHKTPGQSRLALKRAVSGAPEGDARAAPRPRVPQPLPQRRGIAVPPVFQQWARENNHTAAVELSESRAAFGEEKYGQPLMTEDGRDSIEDAKG